MRPTRLPKSSIRPMKTLLLLVAVLSAKASVLPCITETLNNYDSTGFQCSENDILFSNFKVSSAQVPDSSVEVTPLSDGFQFTGGFSVPNNASIDIVLSYTESLSNPLLRFTSDSLAIQGFGQSQGGFLDVAETVCLNSAYQTNGVCPTRTVSLNVFSNATTSKASDLRDFGGQAQITVLGIVKDISIVGPAQVSVIDNVTPTTFVAETPEPITTISVGLGLLVIGAALTRYRNKGL